LGGARSRSTQSVEHEILLFLETERRSRWDGGQHTFLEHSCLNVFQESQPSELLPEVRSLHLGARFGKLKTSFVCSQYWKIRSKDDVQFVSPYATKGTTNITKYASFEPDYGGFNNIRMTLETLFVFAKATGRTIVLPPRAPIYLLKDALLINGSASVQKSMGQESSSVKINSPS
jgi:hypothetical protein